MKVYDSSFYKNQVLGSYQSAKFFADIIGKYFDPTDIIDVGAGRGSWLKAFHEKFNCNSVVAVDGQWNSQESMVEPYIKFHASDLNETIVLPGSVLRFSLAISVEVAEHVEVSSSEKFVKSLISLSDVVLFSAAFSSQGGLGHINEKKHSSWASIFIANGYVPIDLFRPLLWGHESIPFWYQQNAFLYVKEGSDMHMKFSDRGLDTITNVEFMDCVHPALLARKINIIMSAGDSIFKNIPFSFATKIVNIKVFLKSFFGS